MEQFTSEEINAAIKELSVFNKAEVVYNVSNYLFDFAKKNVKPYLNDLMKYSKKNYVLINTYLRIYGNMCSITKLDNTTHFQAIIMITRSIFELFIDLKLLLFDKNEDEINKYLAFVDIERFRVSKRIVDHFNTHPNDFLGDFELIKKNVNDQENINKIKCLISKYYPKRKFESRNYPMSWTDKTMFNRVKDVESKYEFGNKYLDKFVSTYSVMSWYTHSGSVCYINLTDDIILQEMLNALSLSQELFLEATGIMVKTFKLEKILTDKNIEFPNLIGLRKEVVTKIAIENLKKNKKKDI